MEMNDKHLRNQAMEQNITAESDLTGVMRSLNEDVLERSTGLPSIDLKTRLTNDEVRCITIHDTVISLGCLPPECLLTTRMKKRLSVSLQGLGREEMVKIVQGEREHTVSGGQGGFFNKLKSFVTPQK